MTAVTMTAVTMTTAVTVTAAVTTTAAVRADASAVETATATESGTATVPTMSTASIPTMSAGVSATSLLQNYRDRRIPRHRRCNRHVRRRIRHVLLQNYRDRRIPRHRCCNRHVRRRIRHNHCGRDLLSCASKGGGPRHARPSFEARRKRGFAPQDDDVPAECSHFFFPIRGSRRGPADSACR